MPAPFFLYLVSYLHQLKYISGEIELFRGIWDKLLLYLVLIYLQNSKISAETAPCTAIWDEFSEQHQHQNTKKKHYSMPNLQIIWCKCNAHFGWVITLLR